MILLTSPGRISVSPVMPEVLLPSVATMVPAVSEEMIALEDGCIVYHEVLR